jgi:hypothetical protein
MTGSESQIEWAERIKTSVRAEFDRVAKALRIAADRQQGQDQLDTLAIIAILEDKRVEVLANEQAGYLSASGRKSAIKCGKYWLKTPATRRSKSNGARGKQGGLLAFEQRIPHPLTANGVQRYAPMVPGIYGMSNAREWVYIGQSENIQGALLEHLRVLDTAILKWEPTGFVFEACVGERRQTRQHCLILEYAPICNRGSSRRDQSALRRRPHASQ